MLCVRTEFVEAEGRLAAADAEIRRRTDELPGLNEHVRQVEIRVRAAEQRVHDAERAPADDGQALADAQAALGEVRQELTDAGAAVKNAEDARDEARNTRRQLVDVTLPDLRPQVESAREVRDAREVAAQAHAHAVQVLDTEMAAREAALDSALSQVDQLKLPDPLARPGAAVTNVDAVLADLAQQHYGPSEAAVELSRTLREQHGGTPPARVVLTTVLTRPVPDGTSVPAGDPAMPDLDRVQLAGDLARSLDTLVELRVGDGTTPRRAPYLAYPDGALVRLDVTGRPETVDDAVRRLPQHIQNELGPYRHQPDVRTRLEILHEAEIEFRHDFDAGVASVVANLNRYQGHLAYQWITQPDPPVDAPASAR
ncbi:hypothetical protein C1I95_02145 [Micromonospora craterilacus]|uniref:Uncharacterized protein n=1 Tax=Micromonospora craterilacus TaxID=1655439 RepID=A0A2W2FGQ7_9ACTN|nr:hypothetical protein [Micromonospora craterilacus]PZG23848.1 hypothetical protein C1I95_02145 [Micromonospora craterilacus]